MKLLIITQHGDERLGQRLYRFLQHQRQHGKYDDVDFLCGNPKAYRANTRFIETDLNRSYGTHTPVTYEEKRAHHILAQIDRLQYDYVLDIHASRSQCGKLLIVAGMNSKTKEIIAATTISRIAVMPHSIVKNSFIGNVTHSVSLEVERGHATTEQTLDELVRVVDNLREGKREIPAQREVYYVDDVIPASASIDASAKNFQKCRLGFYPVLFRYTGGSYSSYKGFAAYNRKNIIL